MQNYNNNHKEWHESLFGIVVLTLGLSLLSNWLYDKSREAIRVKDKQEERKRDRLHLTKHHNKSNKSADLAQKEIDQEIY